MITFPVIALVLFVATSYVGFFITRWLIGYAYRRDVIDHPNERSLHARPIPRGGGVSIVIIVTVISTTVLLWSELDRTSAMIWPAAAIAYAALGWLDDRHGLPAGARLLAQVVIAAVFTRICLPPHPELFVGYGVLVWIVQVLVVVWAVNLFNFMDGADGFAGSEAATVAGLAGLIFLVAQNHALAMICVALSGSCIGFLYWNWQPARIFLGDVGSYFVGFQLGSVALMSSRFGVDPYVVAILAAPFVVDATLTLMWRIVRRRPWWRAHRSHLYQLLIRGGWSHARTSTMLIALTASMLAPAAAFVMMTPKHGMIVMFIAYFSTGILWLGVYWGAAQQLSPSDAE